MRIADLSVRQPVFIAMMMAAIVLFGIVSYSRIAVELFPDISLPIVAVTTLYPGTGPQEVEMQVSKPIEEAVSSLGGVENVSSTSSEGISVVIVEYKLESDPRRAATEVRDKIAASRNMLPQEIQEPVIDKFDPASAPIISYGVVGRRAGMPLDRLRNIVEEGIKPLIEKIDGVASVSIVGGREREIGVRVDYAKLQARNVSILQVSQALRAENLNMPAGRLREGGNEYLLRTRGEFSSVAEIGGVIVGMQEGVPVYLREVADVVDGYKDQRALSRLNGADCVLFSVQKQSGANSVAVAGSVSRAVEGFRSGNADVDIRLSSDESAFIRESRDDVMLSLILGAFLASVVVFFSFGDLRNTLITVAGLPICIIGAFTAMYLLDYSVNVITLLALSLSVGLLIDDAIVVRENIFRRLEEYGEDPVTAAREGTSEVGLAVLATTLTVVAVFLPVAFATGIAGKFFRQFGVTVAAAVLISLFEAFTFAPALSAAFFRRRNKESASLSRRITGRVSRLYGALHDLYQPLLRWSMGHRAAVLILATLLLGVSGWMVTLVGMGGNPQGERSEFNLALEYPVGSNLARSDALTRGIEGLIASQPEVIDVFSLVGSSDGAVDQAVLHVRLKPGTKPKPFQDRIRPAVERIPGIRSTFQQSSVMSGAAASVFRQLPIQVNIRGDDLNAMRTLAEEVRSRIARVPGVVDVSTDLRAPRPEAQLCADRERATRLGISTAQLASAIRTFVGGDVPTKFRSGEKEINVRVRLREEDRNTMEAVAALSIPTARGVFVSLDQIAELRLRSGPTQINRKNRARQIVVGGNIAASRGGSSGDVLADARARLADIRPPGGVALSFGGQAEQTAQSFRSLGLSLLLGILFVYMVLASQFRSFTQPFTIMLALPLSVIGAFIALLIVRLPFDVMAFIGLIMLMGLVTKNSILLIDYVNQDRRRGMLRSDAIYSAASKRLRPILMTTFAMILGMIPVAFSFGTGTEFRVSMAVTIIGGLISSTFLTLLVAPVVYTLLDDLTSRVLRKRRAAAELPPPQ